MVRRALFLVIALLGSGYADTGFRDLIQVTEPDGSPRCMAGQLKFSAGSLTCSGNVATVSTGGGGSSPSFPAFVLRDSASTAWSVTISTTGQMVSATSAAPSGAWTPHTLTFRDNTEATWSVSISTRGTLSTSTANSYTPSIPAVILHDDNDIGWIVTISSGGAFHTN